MTTSSNRRPSAARRRDGDELLRAGDELRSERRTWLSRQRPTFVDAFLAQAAHLRMEPGSVIVPADDVNCGVIGILAGSVAMHLRSKRGSDHLVGIQHAGYWCGRCELVALTPPDLVIRARATTSLVHVSGEDVRRLLLEHPAAPQAFAELADEQARGLTTLLEAAFERRPVARLARKLLAAAGADDGEPVRLTQEDIADMTSLSRGTVNRLLAQLAASGAITTAYGRLVIADRARLRQAAGLAADDGAVAVARASHQAAAAGMAVG